MQTSSAGSTASKGNSTVSDRTRIRPGESPVVTEPKGTVPINAPGGAQAIVIETLGKGVAAVLVLAVIAAIYIAGKAEESTEASKQQQARTEQETRLLEYYVMELDGKLMAAGLIDYNESWAARKKAKQKATEEAAK